jgi:hypothetical protein
MAIPDNRMSTEPVVDDFLFPENQDRPFYLIDHEAGPANVNDTTQGMKFQHWILTVNQGNGDVTLTPQTSGSPVTFPGMAVGAQQCSFCFDQNARPAIAYVVDTTSYLYWYNSSDDQFVTTEFLDTVSMMVTLDDKRPRQVSLNDILVWTTKEVNPDSYSLYCATQRERFEIVRTMANDVPPYLRKAGMNDGYRVQVELSFIPPV